MFFCVVGLASGLFIPMSVTETKYLKKVSVVELIRHVNETGGKTVAIFSGNEIAHILLSNMAMIYGDSAEFCVVEDGARFLSKYNCRENSVILFEGSKVWLAASLAFDESGLLFLIHSFLGNSIRSATNKEGLFSTLGTNSFSLVCTRELLDDVVALRYRVAPFLGVFGMTVVDERVLRELDLDPKRIAMFRREDKVLTSVDNNISDIMRKSMPSYRNLVPRDFDDDNKTVVVFSVDSLTADMEDFLYKLSTKFPDFVVGYAPSHVRKIVHDISLLDLPSPSILAVNGFDRSYYPFSGCSVKHFQKDVWFDDVCAYLTGITKGTIPRKYHVQAVEQPPNSALIRLNGATYPDFITNEVTDRVVLYIRDSTETIPFLEDIANEFHSHGITQVKFGVIDVYQNSSPHRFPLMPFVPQIRVFPHENRTSSIPFLHTYSRDLFLTFLNHTTSLGLPIPLAAPLDHDTVKQDVGQFVSTMSTYPMSDREKLIPYFRELWLSLNITFGVRVQNNIDPGEYGAEL